MLAFAFLIASWLTLLTISSHLTWTQLIMLYFLLNLILGFLFFKDLARATKNSQCIEMGFALADDKFKIINRGRFLRYLTAFGLIGIPAMTVIGLMIMFDITW